MCKFRLYILTVEYLFSESDFFLTGFKNPLKVGTRGIELKVGTRGIELQVGTRGIEL